MISSSDTKTLKSTDWIFADLNPVFFSNAVVMPAHSNRVLAIGPFDETVIAVVFVVLGSEAVSVVSMRPASRKERTIL